MDVAEIKKILEETRPAIEALMDKVDVIWAALVEIDRKLDQIELEAEYDESSKAT